MSRINPFVLIAVLILVLLLLVYKTSTLKDEVKDGAKAVLLLEGEAKKLITIKKVWDKTNLEARLKSVFSDGRVTDKGKVFEVKASPLSKQDVNDLVSKSFSEAFEIEKFVLSAEKEDSWSLILEVAK